MFELWVSVWFDIEFVDQIVSFINLSQQVALPRPKPVTIWLSQASRKLDWHEPSRRPGNTRFGIGTYGDHGVLMITMTFGAKLSESFCWLNVGHWADITIANKNATQTLYIIASDSTSSKHRRARLPQDH
jgi:hypothetical protein